ncbi:MAG TPA: MATE family efflux transporter [Bacillota bacterium]|jgi:putative MATE family efflux protein|nr:MATE family efflux transporter [Fastidiosipila sp.]HPX92723.1 MATE family efflux transporter [Bacillota bacterium]HQB80620.1 MATE family efflux transporter [Bacillota bacterium]
MQNKKQLDLLKGRILPTVVKLAMPIMATSFVGLAYNLTDMFWVSSLGERAVAAVGSAGILFWLVESLFALPRIGGQVLVGQSLGAGDLQEARSWARAALRAGYLMAALLTLAFVSFQGPLTSIFHFNDLETIVRTETYLWIVGLGMIAHVGGRLYSAILTASGNSFTPFVIFVTGLTLNMILDPLFILHFRMDVAGAALATLLSETVAFGLMLTAVRRNEYFARLRLFSDPLEIRRLKPITKLGAPVAMQSGVHAVVTILISRMVVRFGDLAVAAQRLGTQVESISWMTADGFAAAVNAFMAQNFGAGKHTRVRRGYWSGFWLVFAICTVTSLILLFFGAPIVAIFFKDPLALGHGADYLHILSASQLLMGIQLLTSSAFAALGQSLLPSILVTGLMVSRIPLGTYLSGTALGVSGIWWSFSITSNLAGLVLLIALPLYMRKLERRPVTAMASLKP